MVHAIRRLGGAVPTSVVCKKRRELLMEYRIQELKLGGVLDQDDLYEALRIAGFVDIRITGHTPFSVVAAVRIQALRAAVM